jgi:hypothetical protein
MWKRLNAGEPTTWQLKPIQRPLINRLHLKRYNEPPCEFVHEKLGGCTVLNLYESTRVHRRGIDLDLAALRIHTIDTFRIEK